MNHATFHDGLNGPMIKHWKDSISASWRLNHSLVPLPQTTPKLILINTISIVHGWKREPKSSWGKQGLLVSTA